MVKRDTKIRGYGLRVIHSGDFEEAHHMQGTKERVVDRKE